MRYIVVVCLISLCSVGYAQEVTDSLFYFNTIKVKGIYKSFEEFRRNAPSIPLTNGTLIEYDVEESLYQKDIPVAKLNCDSVMPCEKKTPIWGFCDGTSVFISREPKFDKNITYDKVVYMGRYMYYQYIHKSTASATNTGPGSSTGGYVMGGARAKTVVDKAIDINTGETFELSNPKILKILGNDKVLLAEFNKQKHKEQKQVQYLIKYSEKHKEQIKKSYR
ncbi:MAG: hypothetical protein JWM14_1991 [Chitinophagaceae bacterium]|nr:hypothetical protein [Chitinophagaceae bacterium]